ncbi:MAG: FAD-binding oxidoreductase [Candidatus Saccharimonadales bacterium]
MSKIAHYLQEHLLGEVLVSPSVRRYFSIDASIFSVTPAVVVYPRNENDVRKAARFSWQLAERGRTIPITARGLGTDRSGAAIGSGIVMVFPGHMNKVLEFDSKTGNVIIEPGINFGKLQQTLHTHGRFIPPFPASLEYSTVGGAIANNAGGEKSVKYGNMLNYVKSLRVVLANGEVIETKRISKRELNKKLGLATLEGEIYRSIDALIEENQKLIAGLTLAVSKNTAGYNLGAVKHKDGSFDLTPLFVGAQGTLGIITEAELSTELHNPATTLLVAHFDDLRLAEETILELNKSTDRPSFLEAIDAQLYELIDRQNPSQLKGLVSKPYPKMTLFIEFDNLSPRTQKRLAKKIQKQLKRNQIECIIETDDEAKEKLMKLRHAAAAVMAQSEGHAQALPILDDGIVPVERFNDFLTGIYALCDRYKLQTGVWGHAGDANLHLQPFLDLSQVGDRQRIFKVMDDYYKLIISLGGSTSGEKGDGRLRAPYLQELYGAELYALLQKVKLAFDPYGTLNPGVKIGVTLDDIKPLLRDEYNLDHLLNHLPHA